MSNHPAGNITSSDPFRLLVEAVTDYGIFMLDPGGYVTSWNTGAEKCKGYSAAEIIGRHVSICYTAEDIAAGKPERGMRIAREEGRFEEEVQRRRKNGEVFWAIVTITEIRDPSGTPIGFANVTRDITERKRAEEALRTSDSRFRLLVEGIKDYAVMMLDYSGKIQTWNSGAELLFGYAAGEIIGQPLRKFLPPQDGDRNTSAEDLQQSLDSGQSATEGWRVRKDGSRFWAICSTTPVYDSNGELQGFAYITRDLTERKQAETDLRVAIDELSHSNLDLEHFAHVASHDLQEPLRAVAGCIQVLKKRYQGQLDRRADELIEHTVDGVRRMRSLIDDLMAYSQIGSARKPFESCDCNAVLGQALANLVALRAESGAVITFDSLPIIRADSIQMVQVFQNLIGNAIKFRGNSPPRIHIAARRDSTHWSFSVRDTGIGMLPEYSERIFVIFQRLHTRAEYPGTGIGLAICKKIAERHGGEIRVESALGVGSTFTFTIPVEA